MCADCVSGDGQYIRAGGTSMSAPVVAGVVATILEEHPSWTPDQVKGALANNLRSLPGGGHELDAFAAFNASKRELTSNVGPRAERDRRPRHRRGRLGPLPLEPVPVEPLPLEPVAVERRHRHPEPELGRRQLRV